MPDENKLRELFLAHQQKLLASLGASSVHDHPNARGDNAEEAWREMLAKYLPNRYKVDKGFVIDHDGSISQYIDIIIYDRYYSPIVFNEGANLYVPAESVFAVIETKQELDKPHVTYASVKAKSVRDLKRTSAPIRQMNNTVATKVDSKQILAGIVTTRSAWSPPFGTAFADALKETAALSTIEFGCALNDGSFSVVYGDAETSTITTSDTETSLISFFVDLVARLQAMGNPPAIDLRKYYQQSQEV